MSTSLGRPRTQETTWSSIWTSPGAERSTSVLVRLLPCAGPLEWTQDPFTFSHLNQSAVFMHGVHGWERKNNTAPQLNRKESAKHRTKMRKGVRNGKEQKTPFSENVFSDIYSPLMLNTKSEISPTPLETNTYKLKSKTVTMQIKVDPNM